MSHTALFRMAFCRTSLSRRIGNFKLSGIQYGTYAESRYRIFFAWVQCFLIFANIGTVPTAPTYLGKFTAKFKISKPPCVDHHAPRVYRLSIREKPAFESLMLQPHLTRKPNNFNKEIKLPNSITNYEIM